jgi:hypothetical protein
MLLPVVADVAELVLRLASSASGFPIRAFSRAGASGPGHWAQNWTLDGEFIDPVMMMMMMMMMMPGVRDARGHQRESRRYRDSRSNHTHASSSP